MVPRDGIQSSKSHLTRDLAVVLFKLAYILTTREDVLAKSTLVCSFYVMFGCLEIMDTYVVHLCKAIYT